VTVERWIAAGAAGTLFLLLALLARRARRLGEPPIFSVFAFMAVWGVSLGLFSIPWIRYTHTDVEVWIAIYASIASFLGGAFLACRASPKRREYVATPERLAPRRVHVAWLVTGGLALLGFAFFVRAIDATVGWQALIDNPTLARGVQRSAEFEDAYGLGRALSYLSAVSLLLWTVALRERFFTGPWRLVAPLELLVVVPFMFLGERLSLLTAVTWIAAFHLIWRPIRVPRQLILAGLALLAGGLAYFYVIGSHKAATIEAHPEIRNELTTRSLEPLALPYVYSTANIPVFSQMTNDPLAPTTYGQLTILPLVKAVFRVLPLRGTPPEHGAFYPVPFASYNSATWLDPFYRDFGFLGCLFLPAIVGFIVTLAVVVATLRQTLLSSWLAAIGLGLLIFSPLKNQLVDGNTWALLLLAPIVSAFVAERPLRNLRESLDDPRRARGRPVVLLSAIVVGVAGVAVGFTATTTQREGPQSRQAVGERLAAVRERLMRAGAVEGPASSSALASRLKVSDPSGKYEAVPAGAATPATPGVVGVFWNERALRLRSHTRGGEQLEVLGVRRGDEYQVFGPRPLRRTLLVGNRGFEDGLASWSLIRGNGVEVSRSREAHSGRYALRVRFAGRRPHGAGTVTQVVDRLPQRAAGTRYTLREMVMRRGLTRQVVAGFQYLYSDGTSEYVAASTDKAFRKRDSPATGILARSSERWEPVAASAVASKRVSQIRIFAIDSGRDRLRGVIHLDDVSITFAS
jgi:hypothetical protein